jgi:alpha-1,6-mannosyltransferase
MKILDLCEFYSTRGGGVRSYLTRMASAASKAGHELVVVAPGADDQEIETGEGSRVVHYRGPRMPYDPTYHAPLRVDRMRQIVARERPDVLQVSSPFLPALVARSIPRGPAAPRLVTYVHHSDPIGCYLAPLARRRLPPSLRAPALAPAWAYLRGLTRAMDATITAGSWLSAQLEQHGCERVHTVPFGIAHDFFSPDNASPSLRNQLLGSLAGRADAKLLLITGRLAVDKRPDLLVDAAHELARTSPVALVVLGDGPERERLMARAQGLPSAKFLPFLHDRREYASMLASVDLLLHASMCETFGFVIAETLASGTPAVVPNAGAAPHMVSAACAEVYAVDATAREIASAARDVLQRPRDQVRRAAVERSRVHPTMDTHFEQLFALYTAQLSARTAKGAFARCPSEQSLSSSAGTRAVFVPSNA